MSDIPSHIVAYADAHLEDVFSFLRHLAVIPAPSHHEEQRAAFCHAWMTQHIPASSLIDGVHNVICEIGDTDHKPIILMMAHTDIVFDETVPLGITETGGKLYCPGIGDDTANLAVLMLCAKYAAEYLQDSEVAFVFAANVCEEGEGNLKGCKALMERYEGRLREVITFDGYLDTINDNAVGSKRFCIAADVTGGHSFRDFGNTNAIAVICEIVTALQTIPLPQEHITTFNFGKISGGTTVNSIAQHAEVLYEFRADHADNLRYMTARFEEILTPFRERYDVTVTDIGTRPCAEGVDNAAWERLIVRAEQALEGIASPARYPASTDCNIPLSKGIPAVCLGFIRGGGAHTLEEYIEVDSVQSGLIAALRFVASYRA